MVNPESLDVPFKSFCFSQAIPTLISEHPWTVADLTAQHLVDDAPVEEPHNDIVKCGSEKRAFIKISRRSNDLITLTVCALHHLKTFLYHDLE